jgi:hypothetical protein
VSGRIVRKGLSFLLLLFLSAEIYAGEPLDPKKQAERGDTVATRERPEQEQVGHSVGSFDLFPFFNYSLTHDNNVYAVENDLDSDLISVYSPGLAIVSDWSNHGLELSANADLGRYREITSEDYDDYQVLANGWIDALRSTRISAGVAYAHLHETRDSPDDVSGLNPSVYEINRAFVTMNHRPGRISFTPSLDVNKFDYQDVKALFLGRRVVINQDDRDRRETNLELKAAYEIGHHHNVFALARYIVRDYDQLQNLTNLDRSSDGYETGVGMNFDPGGIVTGGHFYVGFRKQRYDGPFPDIDDPVYRFALAWNISTLTTLEVDAIRTTQETSALAYSGFVSSISALSVDHELHRNLILSARYSHINDDYKGISSFSRKDKTDTWGIGLKWVPNRVLSLAFQLENTNRNSSDDTIPPGFADGDYESEVYWVRIEIKP